MSKSYFDDCMNEEQLKARYRELCVKMHPDRNTENPNATAEFQEMQQQYEERKAELAGDYTKARKGRERREREAKERQERERKERERMKVAMVVEQARQNRQKTFSQYSTGDYIYARHVKGTADYWNLKLTVEVLLGAAIKHGVDDECVVLIEKVVDINGCDFMQKRLDDVMPDGIWGGWEVIQSADPSQGIKKAKRVAKVIMFRTHNYCLFGNPQGDHSISDYYVPANYEAIFATELDAIRAKIEFEKQEKARAEAERKAMLWARQKPVMDEWGSKLIELSAGLTPKEKLEVSIDNLKTMLKGKFPGTTFKVKANKYVSVYHTLQWEDGPTKEEVQEIVDMFDRFTQPGNEITPWMERFGMVRIEELTRNINVLTKAKILQQLGQISESFRNRGIDEEVALDDMDWMMLHLMVGVDINSEDARLCMSTMTADGKRLVKVLAAVTFIFRNTSYKKAARKTKRAA